MPYARRLSFAQLPSSALGALDETGQWWPTPPATPAPFQIQAIHAHLLPVGTGKVLFWPKSDEPYLWDIATNTFTAAPISGHNIFCSGHAFLPGGKLLVTGGHKTNYEGISEASKYDPFPLPAGSWTAVDPMNDARWYPTTTALPNGEALVISGEISNNNYNDEPQVFYGASSWRSLTNAPRKLPYYPYMFVAPSGKVFRAGPNAGTRYLNTVGTGDWDDPVRPISNFGTRNWGSAVMYEPGKILLMGGTKCDFYGTCTYGPTNTAEIIDLNSATPTWTDTDPMPSGGRKLHNATLLANGKVFVTGGSRGPEKVNDKSSADSAALECEIWNPDTEAWSVKPSLKTFRGYHSIALLLPDGRVLSAGGNYAGPDGDGSLKETAEIYSPPYLFSGNSPATRPTITSVPANGINYGQSFFVETPNAATSISKINFLALGSVTHGFNMGQRLVKLTTFSQGSGGLNVTAPANSKLAPPGYYMLFILNNNGVPSVAKFIKLNVP